MNTLNVRPCQAWRRLAPMVALALVLMGPLLLWGCGGGGDGNGPAAGTLVGPAGGTVTGPGGIELTVPAGALATEQRLQIVASTRSLPTAAGQRNIGPAVDLLPHGTRFNQPVRLSIPIEARYRRPGATPWLLKWSGDGDRMDQIVDGQVDGDRLVVSITSFSSVSGRLPIPGPPPVAPWNDTNDKTCPEDPPPWAELCPVFTLQPPVLVTVTEGSGAGSCVGCFVAQGSQMPFDWGVGLNRPVAPLHIVGWQWFKGTGELPGQTGPFLVLPAASAADSGVYRVRVTNEFHWSTTSHPMTLNVVPPGPPTITAPPVDLSVRAGGRAEFRVTAAGPGPLSYEWLRNGQALSPAATSDQLVLDPVGLAADGGRYQVRVGNAGGSVLSATATLQVLPPLDVPAVPHALAAGSANGALLSSDASLRTWGNDDWGGLGDGVATHDPWVPDLGPYRPVGLDGVRSVVAAPLFLHLLAIRGPDEEVWGWGFNGSGQVAGPVGTGLREAPARIGTLAQVRDIAAGERHSLAVRADGSLWAWGGNGRGQLGLGPLGQQTAPVQVVLPAVVAVAAGRAHSLAVGADNTVWAWGANDACQLGHGGLLDQARPVQITGFDGQAVVAVAAGGAFSMALTDQGEVWVWGGNASGELGQGLLGGPVCTPTRLGLPSPALRIAAGDRHGLALLADHRALYGWGANTFGQVAAAATAVLAPVSMASGVDDFAAGGWSTLWAIGNELFGRGLGSQGVLGNDGVMQRPTDPDRFLGITWP